MTQYRKKDLSVPFGANWYRCESCELKKRKGEWVFYFSGTLTEYAVGFETYRDFRSLTLPKERKSEPPNEDVLSFLQKWGPLGLFYNNVDVYFMTPDRPSVRTKIGHNIPLVDYWSAYHTRKIRMQYESDFSKRVSIIEHDRVFDNYFETWDDIHLELRSLQNDFLEIEKTNDLDYFDIIISESSLRPHLIQIDDNKYEWSFYFSSLIDALIGLHGQAIIGKVRMESCDNCGTLFDTISTGRRRFCSDACSVKYSNKKMLSDPLIKEKRKLQARAGRRGLEEEKVAAIKREISLAKSQKELKATEKKYSTILERRKPGR